MSLFGTDPQPRTQSAVLILITGDTVTGACVSYREGELPALLYVKDVPLQSRADEAWERALERGLDELTHALITLGAPLLLRATGTGSAGMIIVSIDAPGESAALRVEKIEEQHPFTFTQQLLAKHLAKNQAPPGMVLADESLIGAILNGYEVPAPFGRRVTEATALVLESRIARESAEVVAEVIRRAYHTKNIFIIAGTSARYQALRAAFAVERDCLIVDSLGPDTTLALVRHGMLAGLHRSAVLPGIAALARQYPLPHLVFNLAGESGPALPGAEELATFWPPEHAPKIVALAAHHLGAFIRTASEERPNLALALLTLYGQTRSSATN